MDRYYSLLFMGTGLLHGLELSPMNTVASFRSKDSLILADIPDSQHSSKVSYALKPAHERYSPKIDIRHCGLARLGGHVDAVWRQSVDS